MGRRKQLWIDKVLQNGGADAGEVVARMMPESTVHGKKDGNIQTLPMSDRKRQLVKIWVTTGKQKRKGW